MHKTHFPERDAELVEKYLAGESLGSLASGLSFSRQRIHQIIQREGVYRPPVSLLRQMERDVILTERKEQIIHDRAVGYDWGHIYHSLNLDMSYVHFTNWLKHTGLWTMKTKMGSEILCPSCDTVKSRDCFYNNRSRPNGKYVQCKQCRNEFMARTYGAGASHVWQ